MADIQIALIAASGFIISPISTYLVQRFAEKSKNKQIKKSFMLNKKLEAAEDFLNHYSTFLSAMSQRSFALKHRLDDKTKQYSDFKIELVGDLESTINDYNRNKGLVTTKILMYFNLGDVHIIDIETDLDIATLSFNLQESIDHKDLQKMEKAFDDICAFSDEFVERNLKNIDKIMMEVKREIAI